MSAGAFDRGILADRITDATLRGEADHWRRTFRRPPDALPVHGAAHSKPRGRMNAS
jgi:hypothetical protein